MPSACVGLRSQTMITAGYARLHFLPHLQLGGLQGAESALDILLHDCPITDSGSMRQTLARVEQIFTPKAVFVDDMRVGDTLQDAAVFLAAPPRGTLGVHGSLDRTAARLLFYANARATVCNVSVVCDARFDRDSPGLRRFVESIAAWCNSAVALGKALNARAVELETLAYPPIFLWKRAAP